MTRKQRSETKGSMNRTAAAAETTTASICAALDALRLPKVREALDAQLEKPTEGLSRLEWLWTLIEPQITYRVERRIERRVREARLPVRKTLEAFDFDFQPTLDRDLVIELSTLRFLDHGTNILLAGMSGTGKIHIAMALALNACAANWRVRYTTSAEMLETLNASLADESLPKALKQYVVPELLLIDEVGMEQVERGTAMRAGLMQKVLLPGCHEHRSTIITSNIPWDGWGDYLDDRLGATALLDRLIHHSHVIVINGPSWREHEHKMEVEAARTNAAAAKPPRGAV